MNHDGCEITTGAFGTKKQRVQRGAKWLDEKRPGWAKEIDLEKLNYTMGDRCILGQLYANGGHWFSAVKNAFDVTDATGDKLAQKYGFMAMDHEIGLSANQKLQELWVLEIEQRLNAPDEPKSVQFTESEMKVLKELLSSHYDELADLLCTHESGPVHRLLKAQLETTVDVQRKLGI